MKDPRSAIPSSITSPPAFILFIIPFTKHDLCGSPIIIPHYQEGSKIPLSCQVSHIHRRRLTLALRSAQTPPYCQLWLSQSAQVHTTPCSTSLSYSIVTHHTSINIPLLTEFTTHDTCYAQHYYEFSSYGRYLPSRTCCQLVSLDC
jgi:hypothetical protein